MCWGAVMSSVLETLDVSGGYVTTAQVTRAGVPRRVLQELVESGELVHVDRGLYALPHTWEDPFFIAQHRFSRGVFSDDTALYLNAMTDRVPFTLAMTFPRSYNKTRAKAAGIHCRSCADGLLELGATDVVTSYGNTVRAYDAERTFCDLVRAQRVVDTQVLVPAMQAYAQSADKDPQKLITYARALGVESKIRTYLEILL